jgi:LacI family transcriptional regulator
MRGRVDGLIVMWPDMDADAAVRNLPAGFPMVLLHSPAGPAAFDVITIANFDGAYAMVRHLIGLGHARIAIIGGVAGNFDAAERLRGYRAALADSAVATDAAIEEQGDFSEDSGFLATQRLLGSSSRPTAIFAANDSMAIGALSALREAGLRVPDDIAVAGFDDIPMARYLDPPLSSVHVDMTALGERATLRLVAALRDQSTHERRAEILPTTLMLRRSCGAAAPSSRPTARASGTPPSPIHSP